MELQTSPSKQRRYKEAKLNLERTPQKATKVDIGFAFPRWTALRRDRCFQSDAELASFLLDSYERGAATPSSMNGKPAVSEFDASRGTERRLYSKDSSGVSEKKSFRPDEPRDQSFVSPTRAESEELVQTHVRRSLVFPAEDQQDQQDPVLLHIKEEQEELLTSQDGEQLNGLEETDNTRLPFSAVIVKSEDDEEKPQCSQLYQSQIEDDREAECQISCATKIKTETDGEDCGGAEPTRNPASNNLSQQNTDAKTSVSCETEVSIGADDEGSGNDTDDWQEPLTESGSETEDSDSGCKESRARAFACSECGKRFRYKWSLQRHMTGHSGKMSSSSFANKKCFTVRQTADLQIKVHTGEKPYGCSLCGQRFRDQYNLKRHMRIHTGEKPFGCGVCGKRFNGEGNLKIHKRVHTGEKPFGCGVCGKKFKQKSHFSCDPRLEPEGPPQSEHPKPEQLGHFLQLLVLSRCRRGDRSRPPVSSLLLLWGSQSAPDLLRPLISLAPTRLPSP
ncbi:zinc finger protein 260-like [Archocentrus centrarchus]|uniref:zinc finger protein 260-like n=1 Tax=Archocentrus centrarchus TaxID=63155 RepID=UPI0011EA0D8E|nr:zinc finger protein 260-like [Archocentrus centrarchus]